MVQRTSKVQGGGSVCWFATRKQQDARRLIDAEPCSQLGLRITINPHPLHTRTYVHNLFDCSVKHGRKGSTSSAPWCVELNERGPALTNVHVKSLDRQLPCCVVRGVQGGAQNHIAN